MIDEQIRNIPACSMCNLPWSKTAPLCAVKNMLFCGNCLDKVIAREKSEFKKWVEEQKNGN